MAELRIDPLTGQRTIVAGREDDPPPGLLEAHRSQAPLATFTPEGLAPPQPSEDPARLPGVNASRDLFWSAPAGGAREVIPAGEAPVPSLADLGPEEVAGALERWRERMRAHASAACLHLSLDQRPAPGEEKAPPQAQLHALDFVPAAIARERERAGAYNTRTMGGNLLADLVQEEVRRRERIVAIDPEAVLMAPYASRVPYQLLLAPRTPRARFEDPGPSGAAMLHGALSRLARRLGAHPPLTLWVRTAPRGGDHPSWRIDVLPRLLDVGGLELGAGVHLNPVAPERAAAELREA